MRRELLGNCPAAIIKPLIQGKTFDQAEGMSVTRACSIPVQYMQVSKVAAQQHLYRPHATAQLLLVPCPPHAARTLLDRLTVKSSSHYSATKRVTAPHRTVPAYFGQLSRPDGPNARLFLTDQPFRLPGTCWYHTWSLEVLRVLLPYFGLQSHTKRSGDVELLKSHRPQEPTGWYTPPYVHGRRCGGGPQHFTHAGRVFGGGFYHTTTRLTGRGFALLCGGARSPASANVRWFR